MEQLAIIGAGTMGHSIALNAAWKNLSVSVYAVDDQDIRRAKTAVNAKLEVLGKNDLVTPDQVATILSEIKYFTELDAVLEGASFVIEAIPEDISLKREWLAILDSRCDPSVVLASNTSGLSVSALVEGMHHPERFLITHFWNPAHLVPLVELLGHSGTASDTVDRAKALLQRMDKKPVLLKKEVPGMIGNRLQFALLREAQFLLDNDFASREDIDNAIRYGIARRLPVTGPLRSADMGGLDVFAAISEYLFPNLSHSTEVSPSLKKLVQQGSFGQKSGSGYYEWQSEESEAWNTERENELIRFLKQDQQKPE